MFRLTEEAAQLFPRKKSSDMNFPVVLGIPNAEAPYRNGEVVKAKFRNVTLYISPTKPVDHTMELIKIVKSENE